MQFAISLRESADSPPVYGFCPKCGARGKTRERRLGGNDTCQNGHVYPSRDAKPEPKGIALCESVEMSADDLVIDEENCVVKNVVVLGAISKNRLAFPEATRKDALPLVEGAVVNWDHIPKGATETPLASRFGWLSDAREDVAGNRVRANLHYLKGHKHVGLFLSIVKQNPRLCGFSVLGSATPGGKDSEGRTIVAKITKVKSFDLVADPANTLGLREAEEMAPVVPAAPEGNEGAEGNEDSAAESDNYIAVGCMKAIEEVLAGEGTPEEKYEKIKTHIKQAMEMEGDCSMSEDDAESESENTEDMKESVREVRKKHCVELCEAHKVQPTAERLQLLIRIPKAKREGAVKKMALVQKPRSGAALRESANGASPPPPPPPPPAETEEQIQARIAKAFKGY